MRKWHSCGLSTDCLAIEGAFSNSIAGIFLKPRNPVSLFLAFVSYKHLAVTTGWFKKLWYFHIFRALEKIQEKSLISQNLEVFLCMRRDISLDSSRLVTFYLNFS